MREGNNPVPDATAEEGDWSCVDLVPYKALKNPVTLEAVKASAELKDIALIKQSRLSVMPLTTDEYAILLRMSKSADDE